MSKYQYYSGRFFLLLSSILIGIPMGILVGLIYFLRIVFSYPISMYKLSVDKWDNRLQVEQADMWTRHIARMEQNKNEN